MAALKNTNLFNINNLSTEIQKTESILQCIIKKESGTTFPLIFCSFHYSYMYRRRQCL